MKRSHGLALLALLLVAGAGPLISGGAQAGNLTDAELMQAATDLAHRYDANYGAKDPAAMAALYATDGVLVSPSGPLVRGRDALLAYYTKRFASGARGHKISVTEVHVQGDGGYGISKFSVTTPDAGGALHDVRGTIVAIYGRYPDGWHLRLVEPSIPEAGGK
jgi:uncharacterized protein (TIGR02246 family)